MYMCVYVCVCMCVSVCVSVCVYVCVACVLYISVMEMIIVQNVSVPAMAQKVIWDGGSKKASSAFFFPSVQIVSL